MSVEFAAEKVEVLMQWLLRTEVAAFRHLMAVNSHRQALVLVPMAVPLAVRD